MKFFEETSKNEEWMKSHFINRLYLVGFVIIFATCWMSLSIFLTTELSGMIGEVRSLAAQVILLLFTFTVALHAHELRALRMEKSKLLEMVYQLELKRIESEIVLNGKSSLQNEMSTNLENTWYRISGSVLKNSVARSVLYPVARLCILDYSVAITLLVVSSLVSGNHSRWLDALSTGFLASGFVTLVFGFFEIIRRD